MKRKKSRLAVVSLLAVGSVTACGIENRELGAGADVDVGINAELGDGIDADGILAPDGFGDAQLLPELALANGETGALAPTPFLDEEGEFVPGQYIAVLRDGARFEDLLSRYQVEPGITLEDQNAIVLTGLFDARLISAIRADVDVADLVPDAIAHIAAAQVLPPGVDRVGADENPNKGTGVKVCIVDTGMDLAHADLAATYAGGWDFANNDSNPSDDNDHGTHVAGIIAAQNNTTDVIGVATGARLYIAKALDAAGSGSYSNIAAAVNWCKAQGVKVINMSLSGTSNDATLKAALDQAKAAGVTNVVAAGNSGRNLDIFREYPAAWDGTVFTVAAIAIDDTNRAFGGTVLGYPTFSNYGACVDLSAPGYYVESTKRGGGTIVFSGTSMSSPHVAGAAAIYVASHASATPDQVMAALKANTENVPNVRQHPEEMLNVRGL